MASPLQRQFDFDMTTLNLCISNLRPPGLRQLFRGLLFAAAHQPNLVSDIDSEGCVIMTASIEVVAGWSGCSDRTIRRNKISHADLVTHSAGANTPSEWFFNLRSVLPLEAIPWYVELVENAKCHPDKCHGVTLTKRHCHPDILQNVTLTKPNVSSTCFQLSTGSLAGLAESLESLGIAAKGDDWQTLQVDYTALNNPAAVAAIATAVGGNEAQTRRVFVAAVVSQGKDTPWNYFRWLLVSGNYLTTFANKQQIGIAENMLRITSGSAAAVIRPTVDEAWAKVLSSMRLFDYMHQLEELKAELGPEICAAVRASGGFRKIGEQDPRFQKNNRAAFVDAYKPQHPIAATMQQSR